MNVPASHKIRSIFFILLPHSCLCTVLLAHNLYLPIGLFGWLPDHAVKDNWICIWRHTHTQLNWIDAFISFKHILVISRKSTMNGITKVTERKIGELAFHCCAVFTFFEGNDFLSSGPCYVMNLVCLFIFFLWIFFGLKTWILVKIFIPKIRSSHLFSLCLLLTCLLFVAISTNYV